MYAPYHLFAYKLHTRAKCGHVSCGLTELISVIWTDFRNAPLIAMSFHYPSFTDLV